MSKFDHYTGHNNSCVQTPGQKKKPKVLQIVGPNSSELSALGGAPFLSAASFLSRRPSKLFPQSRPSTILSRITVEAVTLVPGMSDMLSWQRVLALLRKRIVSAKAGRFHQIQSDEGYGNF